jgi:predicted metal-dependent hydrolase
MDYDVRYLGGVRFFNEGDFFEAHEVWEGLWLETSGPERRFYQGLIQAAVALYHFGNGNLRGAVKLYGSSLGYLEQFAPTYLGLNLEFFRQQMERCFAEALSPLSGQTVCLQEDLVPRIDLDPEPSSWPEPTDFVDPDSKDR